MGVFQNQVVPVMVGKKYAVADLSGKLLFQPVYDLIELTKDDYAIAKNGDKKGVLSLTGKVLIPLIYHSVFEIKQGTFAVGTDDNFGVIDSTGKMVIPVEYSGISLFGEGYSVINHQRAYALYNPEGKRISAFGHRPDSVFPFWHNDNDSYYVFNPDDRTYHYYEELKYADGPESGQGPIFFYRAACGAL